MKSRIPKDSWVHRISIAHRGLHDDQRPENSLSAFEAAVAHGYAIELDLHLLPDGGFAVFHDDDLQRMTGQPGRIQTLTSPRLVQFQLKGSQDVIPEFQQVLQTVGGKVPLLIEMKLTSDNQASAQALNKALEGYEGEYVVESFDPRFLLALKEVAPQMFRGQLAAQNSGYPDAEENRRLAECAYNHLTEPDFIAYQIHDLPLPWLSAMRDEGMPVLGWTVRTWEQWEKARPHCDNLIFEGIRFEGNKR